MSVLQLIDENKRFSPDVKQFLKSEHCLDAGLNYHLVAVFGSQSTGKSTLLNALFNTHFGVMDEKSRQQTTKGIWMGCCPAKNAELLVLDVEGTDGRERGEDQDFERKSALFALASSEVLLVNMWEHQVGLYQGANMGLLKTVFEVNLSLFQSSSSRPPRSKILFVIRDFIGTTPLANLEETLLNDLHGHWDSIAKPTAELEGSKISDFFDIEFTALPHKVLQEEKFSEGVRELREDFISGKLFDPAYHRSIPIDGWPHYAEQIWEQVELNKDLDLPTQQILVARFRCKEIGDLAWKEFSDSLDKCEHKFGGTTIIPRFGEILRPLRKTALETFDSQASKYNESVYKAERSDLLEKLDGLLISHYKAQLDAASRENTVLFQKTVTSEVLQGTPFLEATLNARKLAERTYLDIATESSLDPDSYLYDDEEKLFHQQLDTETSRLRDVEVKKLSTKAAKKAKKELQENVPPLFRNPGEDTWEHVLTEVARVTSGVLKPFESGTNFGLGGSVEENQRWKDQVVALTWKQFEDVVRDLLRHDAVVTRLRDIFNDLFMYDKNGTPVMWKQGDDIEAAYLKARDSALQTLTVFSSARLPDGEYVEAPVPVQKYLQEESYEGLDFTKLLSESAQEQIRSRFFKDANTAFINAKHSISQTSTHIPPYMWLILVVLGWNEFMAVLRNPLLITLGILLGAGVYVTYHLGMTQHVLSIAEASFERFTEIAREQLKKFVLEEPAKKQNSPEEIELKDLSDVKQEKLEPISS